MESHTAAHIADQEELPAKRFNVPADAKAGGSALGIRQPENITNVSAIGGAPAKAGTKFGGGNPTPGAKKKQRIKCCHFKSKLIIWASEKEFMTIVSHLLLTTAGVQLFGLQGREMFLAYAFGVLVDLDHLIKIPLYFKKHSFNYGSIIKKSLPKEKHYNWRTPFQEPISLLWIIPLSIFLDSPVPIIFFMSHFALDYLISYTKFPFYPFSSFSTKGFLANMSNNIKELLVALISLCSIILLY